MGGEGSGRKPDPMKQVFKPQTPIAHAPEPMLLPDYSGVQKAALKTEPAIGGGGAAGLWKHTVAGKVLEPLSGSNMVSGAALVIAQAISGGIFIGPNVTSVDEPGHTHSSIISGTASDYWVSGATLLRTRAPAQTISGAAFVADGDISGATIHGDASGATIPLDTIENPLADVDFNFGNNKTLDFRSVDTTVTPGQGVFNFTAGGAFNGSLVHIHQHTGNPGADTILLEVEADDADVIPLHVSGANAISAEFHNEITSPTITGISGATELTTTERPGISGSIEANTAEIVVLSGATVQNAVDILSVSGATVQNAVDILSISGATVQNATDILSISGATVENQSVFSGATVQNAADILSISGATVQNAVDILSISGATVQNATDISILSGATVLNATNIDGISGSTIAHYTDSTDPHGKTLTQTNVVGTNVSGSKIIALEDKTGALSGAATVINFVYGTGATPNAASSYPMGTVYLQHAA